MTDERIKALWKKGVQLMGEHYTWAEAILQVLRENTGWDATPYQWATAGYMGAINSGKTICGVLFGGSIYLGFLNGKDSTNAPELKDEGRINNHAQRTWYWFSPLKGGGSLPPEKASWSCPLVLLKFELQLLFSAFICFLVLYIFLDRLRI